MICPFCESDDVADLLYDESYAYDYFCKGCGAKLDDEDFNLSVGTVLT